MKSTDEWHEKKNLLDNMLPLITERELLEHIAWNLTFNTLQEICNTIKWLKKEGFNE